MSNIFSVCYTIHNTDCCNFSAEDLCALGLHTCGVNSMCVMVNIKVGCECLPGYAMSDNGECGSEYNTLMMPSSNLYLHEKKYVLLSNHEFIIAALSEFF